VVSDSLIQSIVDELHRIWPGDCFEGANDQYAWLYEHYGIPEQDNVKWQCALADWMDEDPDFDIADPAARAVRPWNRQIVRSDRGAREALSCAPMCPEVVNNLQEEVRYPRRVSQEMLSWLTGASRDG
jgi:hypothetical protein